MKKEALKKLQNQKGNLLSIYIPTEVTGDYQKSRIRFKNAVAEAEKLMENHGEDISRYQYLNKADEFLDHSSFWAKQSSCLAYFADGKEISYYHLPVHVDSLIHFGEEFITYPIQQFLSDKQRYYILTLSWNDIQLYEANAYSIAEVRTSDLGPKSVEEILKLYNKEEHLQHHSARNTVFHAQGGGEQNEDEHRMEFLRKLNEGLMEILHDQSVPMVLAGTEEIVSMFKEASTYSHITNDYLSGNHNRSSLTELQSESWSIIKSEVNNGLSNEEYANLENNGSIITEWKDIIEKINLGQIDTIYLKKDYNNPNLNKSTMELESLHRKAESRGSNVFWCEETHGNDAFATLRYKI